MKRQVYIIIGSLSLVLGFIGIFLPLLPTTPFAILSAYCFKKGSDRLYRWLLNQPVLGKAIQDWDRNKVIRPKTKAFAISLILISLSYPILFKTMPIYLKLMALTAGLLVSGFILTRKSSRT